MTVLLENGARQGKEDVPSNIPIYKPLTTSHGNFLSYTMFILLPGFERCKDSDYLEQTSWYAKDAERIQKRIKEIFQVFSVHKVDTFGLNELIIWRKHMHGNSCLCAYLYFFLVVCTSIMP